VTANRDGNQGIAKLQFQKAYERYVFDKKPLPSTMPGKTDDPPDNELYH
jgi:hypothetical protein